MTRDMIVMGVIAWLAFAAGFVSAIIFVVWEQTHR